MKKRSLFLRNIPIELQLKSKDLFHTLTIFLKFGSLFPIFPPALYYINIPFNLTIFFFWCVLIVFRVSQIIFHYYRYSLSLSSFCFLGSCIFIFLYFFLGFLLSFKLSLLSNEIHVNLTYSPTLLIIIIILIFGFLFFFVKFFFIPHHFSSFSQT